MQKRKPINILIALAILAILSCVLFVVWNLDIENIDYNLPRRLIKLIAFILTGCGIGISTVVFQTVTNNRILTPSIMGLDSLYLFIQTLLLFFFGSGQLIMMNRVFDYFLSIAIMLLFSLFLFKIIFRNEGRQITTVVLAGIVFGSLFGSLSTFMQVLIDPNEFLLLQNRMFASFNKINNSLLSVSFFIIVVCVLYIFSCHRKLDVMALGRDISINLGANHEINVTRFMLMVSVLTAVSTALVGPVTFLGLITANLSRQLLKTYRHSYILLGACLSSISALALGQFITERIFNFGTTISVIINFIGGIYFIMLMLKEGKF